jgi:hypothetical protein
MLIKYVYIVFIGILLAAFVGVGIAAFYKGPKPPEYPVELQYPEIKENAYLATPSAQRVKLQQEQDSQFKEFRNLDEIYQRNVSIIALLAAVIMLVISLTLLKQIQVIADGLLLGGVITLGYSVVRGFGSNDDMVRFMVVTASLLVSIILGYIKFVRPVK